MSNQILIRGVPPETHQWIEQERRERLMSQNEFMLDLLDRGFSVREQIPLFNAVPRARQMPGQLPFTFIDLFAGIGGMRLGLEKLGGTSVFSSEWDKNSQRTYREWFGEVPRGDIREIKPAEIPDHDLLAAGFPCQPFSIAGVSKKKSLGRAHGFKDVAQGTLFFYLASIIEAKRPPVFLLENVKNLVGHDKGRTWKVIHDRLTDLKYSLKWKVIDAAGWVPQHRERVFIVGFDEHVFGRDVYFQWPDPPARRKPKFSEVLDEAPDPKYTLSAHLWDYLQRYAERHREKGNGFGFSLADPEGVSRTLSARYYKDGSEILIAQGGRRPPRRLMPRECARLMGFPEDLKIVVSDTQAYRQFGNAVVPPVVEAVARSIAAVLASYILKRGGLLQQQSR